MKKTLLIFFLFISSFGFGQDGNNADLSQEKEAKHQIGLGLNYFPVYFLELASNALLPIYHVGYKHQREKILIRGGLNFYQKKYENGINGTATIGLINLGVEKYIPINYKLRFLYGGDFGTYWEKISLENENTQIQKKIGMGPILGAKYYFTINNLRFSMVTETGFLARIVKTNNIQNSKKYTFPTLDHRIASIHIYYHLK